jgi:NAD(P)-dependent dehydrogenase (short-subunit alcohol dehydrogenase family)
VDHCYDDQVAGLFDQVRREQGRLDILVNNAFAIPQDLIEPKPEKPLSNWDMVDVGIRSNFVAAWHAAQIVPDRRPVAGAGAGLQPRLAESSD